MTDLSEQITDAIDQAPTFGVRSNKANLAPRRYEVFYLDENDEAVVVGAHSMKDIADSDLYSLQRDAHGGAAIAAVIDYLKSIPCDTGSVITKLKAQLPPSPQESSSD